MDPGLAQDRGRRRLRRRLAIITPQVLAGRGMARCVLDLHREWPGWASSRSSSSEVDRLHDLRWASGFSRRCFASLFGGSLLESCLTRVGRGTAWGIAVDPVAVCEGMATLGSRRRGR